MAARNAAFIVFLTRMNLLLVATEIVHSYYPVAVSVDRPLYK